MAHKGSWGISEAVHEVLKQVRSIFICFMELNGFMNGCSARGTIDLPQESLPMTTTLNEAEINTQYFAVQRCLRLIAGIPHKMGHSGERQLWTKKYFWATRLVVWNFGSWQNLTKVSILKEDGGTKLIHGYLLYHTEADWDADQDSYYWRSRSDAAFCRPRTCAAISNWGIWCRYLCR